MKAEYETLLNQSRISEEPITGPKDKQMGIYYCEISVIVNVINIF